MKSNFYKIGAFFTLALILFWPAKTFAQYENLIEVIPANIVEQDVFATMQKNGTLEVRETFKTDSFSGNNLSLAIPQEGTRKIEVWRENQKFTDFKVKRENDYLLIENLTGGAKWTINYILTDAVKGKASFDEFRFEVLPAGNYINTLKMTIKLPEAVNQNRVKVIHYAIHGIDVSESRLLNLTTLEYGAKNLGPYSSFAAVAEFPKGLIRFSLLERADNFLSNLPLVAWIILSLLLPVATFVAMFLMIYKKRKDENIQPSNEPMVDLPEKISPATVGVLLRGSLGHREIAATIVDMAVRGYLFIVNGGEKEGYRFGERKSFNVLAPHERDLGKELLRGGLKRTVKEIEAEPQAEIFSATVSLVYQDIYKDVARLGYFVEDPAVVHLRYYFAGIGVFLLSIIGFIIAAILLPYPPFLLFAFFAMAISSLVMMKMSNQMPVRTEKGKQALSRWLAFRNTLVNYSKPGYREVMQDTFFNWLPFAIALEVEDKWASHFVTTPFSNPEWYAAFQEFHFTKEFTKSFYPIIDYIGDIMDSMREPVIK